MNAPTKTNSVGVTVFLYQSPILEATTSKGGLKFWWSYAVEQKDNLIATYTAYCQTVGKQHERPEVGEVWETSDKLSAITTSAPTYIQGKNLGRANETTAADQAVSEVKSAVKRQMDKGYYYFGQPESRSLALTLPMLAYEFKTRKHGVIYPCSIQPKYDGVRCLSDGEFMWSRKGLVFEDKVVDHLLQSLDTRGLIVDGELIMPEGTLLQDTVRAVKKYRAELSTKLIYRIYDVVSEDSYPERHKRVQEIVELANNPQIVCAPREEVTSDEEVYAVHAVHMAEGWEGSMVRAHGAGYKVGHRSAALLKVKDFLEEEFLVVDVIAGEGKFSDAAVFVCETSEGLQFKVAPVGDMAEKKRLLDNPKSIIGRMWTVRFQFWSADKKPQHARAICERDGQVQG